MKNTNKYDLINIKFNKKFLCLIIGFWTIAFTILTYSPLGNYLGITISRALEFKVREYLKQDPPLHPKIKILAIDDSTVSYLNSPALSYEQWSTLLLYLDMHKPTMIIIDKMFSISEGFENEDSKIKLLEKTLKNIKTPVLAGVMVTNSKIKYREELNLDQFKIFNVKSIKGLKENIMQWSDNHNTPKYVYGPLNPLNSAFSYLGHIHYQSDGKIYPFFIVNNKYVIPHISLFAASNKYFDKGYFYVEDKIVPMFNDKSVQINFSSYKTYLQNTKSVRNFLEKARKGIKSKYLKQGDYIFIIPYFYSGNTDFKETPLGIWPGGYVHVAMLNNVLTQNWLKPIDAFLMISACSAILGGLVGLMPYLWFVLSTIFIITGLLITSMILFSYFNIIFPWLLAIISFVITGSTVFIIKTKQVTNKISLLKNAFSGKMSNNTLNSIIKNISSIDLEAKERVISIMFIDIAGYSLLAETQSPKSVFEQLKHVISTITEEIYNYGGVVNKILGDGILSFFGYSFEKDEVDVNHLVNAFVAATKIQQKSLRQHLLLAKNNKIFYPLRIGLHTSSVYLGNLNLTNQIEYTLIGNGVNFTKRLENACDLYSIMISSTAWNIIKSSGLNLEGFKKKPINIKHHDEFIEAYEYDPFYDCPELKQKAIEFYRKYINLIRAEHRLNVWSKGTIYVSINSEDGLLLNYSPNGLSIKINKVFHTNQTITLKIKSKNAYLQQLLANHNIGEIIGTVRWGYQDINGYIYGVSIENLTNEQRKYLISTIHDFDISISSSKSKLSKKIA